MNLYEESSSVISTASLMQKLENEAKDWKKKYEDSETEKSNIVRERDSLKSTNSKLEKTKRENSLTISELKSELQKKSDKIVELNNQLSTLENSDPILKEARRIQSLNTRKEEDLAEREKNVRKVEKDTGEKLKNAEKYEAEQKKILDDMNEQVDARAEIKILGIRDELQNEYTGRTRMTQGLLRTRYAAKEWLHRLIFSYCIIWSVIQLITSEALRRDFISIGLWIKDYAVDRIQNIRAWTAGAAGVTEKISNETLAGILHWLILGIVGVLLVALFFGVPLLSVWFVIRYLKNRERFDKVNRWVMVSTAIAVISVGWTDFLGLSKYKLPLIWLGIQVLTPVIRWIWGNVHKEKKDTKEFL